MISNTEFTVVDVETTGLFPQREDRIIEIATIRMDGKGNLIDEYTTLVNPNRDLGATHIHGITAKEVKDAPTFAEVAGDVLDRLSGAVFVAHNVDFDFRFVQSEINRLGFGLPETPLLCTMQLAKEVDPIIPGRSCEVCCTHFGIPLERAHVAFHDAKAIAQLLMKCFDKIKQRSSGRLVDIGIQSPPLRKKFWPQLPASGKSHTREHAATLAASEPSYIARLVASLPAAAEAPAELDEYLPLLDRVLEDRRITSDEADALFELAEELGMSKEQAIDAHHLYMRDLIHVALADGIITEKEQKDLDEVRDLLSIPKENFHRLLSECREARERGGGMGSFVTPHQEEISGKTICFTGEFRCEVAGKRASRSLAQQLSQEKGMIIKKNVIKNLDYLVTADPDSMSGKAKKAREYGIRIIAEHVFWRMLGVDVE